MQALPPHSVMSKIKGRRGRLLTRWFSVGFLCLARANFLRNGVCFGGFLASEVGVFGSVAAPFDFNFVDVFNA